MEPSGVSGDQVEALIPVKEEDGRLPATTAMPADNDARSAGQPQLAATGEPPPAPSWHAESAEFAMQQLKASERGLTEDEAKNRLAEYGPNQLTPPYKPGFLRRLWAQVRPTPHRSQSDACTGPAARHFRSRV